MRRLLDQRIIDCLKTCYGINVISLSFLPWGADINASVYRVEAQEAVYFVKLKQGHQHELSAVLSNLLHAAGVVQIIPPIITTQGQPVQRMEGYTLIVYPFVEGENGFKRTLTKDQWIQLGKAMRQVHQTVIPLSIQNQIRRETYASKWREAVRELYPIIDSEPIGDESALKLLKFMKENKSVIQDLVDTAESLSYKIQQESSPLVLCHSDIHAGNVLIDTNEKLYIIDWDEPMMAPIERDLMFIGGGVGNVWNNIQEIDYFYEGYGKAQINQAILAYYRHERIVEDIAIYGQQLLLTQAGDKDRPIMLQHFVDMFEPNGVIEIAFRTKDY
jgi:spectinomycin phosphotransferase